jgi:hypothetical protein
MSGGGRGGSVLDGITLIDPLKVQAYFSSSAVL